MKLFTTTYTSKGYLYPKFGTANSGTRTVCVRSDLPESVKNFILSHEIYHLDDPARFWIWREIKANIHAARKHPIGFLRCAWLSMAPYRIAFYIRRLMRGE